MTDASHATRRLVLASRNAKKVGELRDLLAPHSIAVDGIDTVPGVGEIVEDGDSFAANAAIKAKVVALAAGCYALGEDSGLCVDALGGAPGIYSARFAGAHGDDAANNAKLIAELTEAKPASRGAHYHCAIAVADPSGELILTASGTCLGRIVEPARGSGGFGYDPHFEIREYHRTFGELPPAVKRAISHRARAMRSLVPRLASVLSSGDRAQRSEPSASKVELP